VTSSNSTVVSAFLSNTQGANPCFFGNQTWNVIKGWDPEVISRTFNGHSLGAQPGQLPAGNLQGGSKKCNPTVKQHFWLFYVYIIIHIHRVVLVINNASCRPFGHLLSDIGPVCHISATDRQRSRSLEHIEKLDNYLQ